MMNKTFLASVMAISLAACGGGGGSSNNSPAPTNTNPPPAPAPVTINASGVITGFGSVFLDGVRYEVVSDTEVGIEGEADSIGDDSRLRVGMHVRLRGEEDSDGNRRARRIDYDDDLKGPAMDISPDAADSSVGTFTVLMQTVVVDTNTVFDNDVGDNNGDGNIDIRDLELTNGEVVVEVSGLPIESGILATRIDRVNSAAGIPGVDDDEYEVKGFVDSVAADGSSFVINGATFLVSGATEFDDGLSADDSLVGVFLEVKADIDSNGDLLAVKVEREDDFDDNRDGRVEIKGILTDVDTSATPHTITVGGTTLQVTDASGLTGLVGNLVEIKGSYNADGVLVIDRANPEVENNVRTEDRVATKDLTAGTFTTRLGVVITPQGGSRIEDDVADDDDHLTVEQFLDRLQPNDFIEARGFLGSDDSVSWTRLEREDDDATECRLRGPVESIDGTDASSFSFVILGVTIDVSQVNDDDFEGVNDLPIGRQAFFDQLNEGDVVEAQSDDAGVGCEMGQLGAREVEFELDDGVVGTGGNGTGGQQLTGTPTNVTENSFELNGTTITVIGSTLIDDSIIEAALGREIDGDDQPFDQVPDGLTLPELLTGAFPVNVRVNSDNVAIVIEDL